MTAFDETLLTSEKTAWKSISQSNDIVCRLWITPLELGG